MVAINVQMVVRPRSSVAQETYDDLAILLDHCLGLLVGGVLFGIGFGLLVLVDIGHTRTNCVLLGRCVLGGSCLGLGCGRGLCRLQIDCFGGFGCGGLRVFLDCFGSGLGGRLRNCLGFGCGCGDFFGHG